MYSTFLGNRNLIIVFLFSGVSSTEARHYKDDIPVATEWDKLSRWHEPSLAVNGNIDNDDNFGGQGSDEEVERDSEQDRVGRPGRSRRSLSARGRSNNEIVRGAGQGGRCLTEEAEPEVKYFYLNQNPEEVKILTSDNPTQRWEDNLTQQGLENTLKSNIKIYILSAEWKGNEVESGDSEMLHNIVRDTTQKSEKHELFPEVTRNPNYTSFSF